MLTSLKGFSEISPRTDSFGKSFSLGSVAYALEVGHPKELEDALRKITLPVSAEDLDYLQTKAIDSNWPQGFDRLMEHCTGRADAGTGLFEDGTSMVLLACQKHSYKIMEHLWPVATEEDKERCVEHYMEVGLAVSLMKLGEGKRIKSTPKNRLISRSIELLLDTSGAESRREIKNTIKSLLEDPSPWANMELWRQICKLDDVYLLKELVNEGVIGPKNLTASSVVGSFVSGAIARDKRGRVSKELGLENQGSAQGQEKLKEVRTFSLAELITLLSQEKNKILAMFVGNPDFVKDVLSSPVAKHALVMVACESSTFDGADILGELKGNGVELSTLRNDDQKTPLHVYASECLYVHEGAIAKFFKMAKLHPQWLAQKDSKGQLAIDVVPMECREQVVPRAEEMLLEYELSKGQDVGKLARKIRV